MDVLVFLLKILYCPREFTEVPVHSGDLDLRGIQAYLRGFLIYKRDSPLLLPASACGVLDVREPA